jgi:spore germination protein KC
MNRLLFLIIIILISLSLVGCWNYKEINDIYIVAGLAIDRDASNLFDVTAEIVNTRQFGGEETIYSEKLESQGETIFSAVRDMIKVSARKLYWSHATSIILSEDMAKESILPVLDWVARDQEPRLSMNIFISKEKTAKELLESKSLSSPEIRSFELEVTTNENRDIIETPVISVYELINQLSIPKTYIVIPAIEITSSKGDLSNMLSGGAVFNSDKLVGYLDKEDMLPYLFLVDDINGGLLDISIDNNTNDKIAFEIFKSKTRVHPIYSKEDLEFNIDIKLDVSIGEINSQFDYISEPGRVILKKLTEESLNNKLEEFVKKVQQEFGLDIFGFGNVIRQRNPKTWELIEKDWDILFKELKVNINTEVKIRNSGHFSKPIEVMK